MYCSSCFCILAYFCILSLESDPHSLELHSRFKKLKDGKPLTRRSDCKIANSSLHTNPGIRKAHQFLQTRGPSHFQLLFALTYLLISSHKVSKASAHRKQRNASRTAHAIPAAAAVIIRSSLLPSSAATRVPSNGPQIDCCCTIHTLSISLDILHHSPPDHNVFLHNLAFNGTDPGHRITTRVSGTQGP